MSSSSLMYEPKPELATAPAAPSDLEESRRRYPSPESELRRTELRKWILHYVPKGGIGAEVGAYRGQFSEVLVQGLAPSRFYLVDAWTLAGEFCDAALHPQGAQPVPSAVARQEAQWRMQRFPAVDCRFVQTRFPAGREAIADKLDWLYLDVSHRFEDALQALHAADELLAPKGILFGDDWWPEPHSAHHGVFQAVNKFTRLSKFELVAAGPYGQWALRRRGPWRLRPEGEDDAPAARGGKAARPGKAAKADKGGDTLP